MSAEASIPNRAAALRLVRALKYAFALSPILFLLVIIRIPARNVAPPEPTVVTAITIVALTMIILGYAVPRSLAQVGQNSQATATLAGQLQSWLSRNLIGFAFLEACSLFAFVLHFLGAELRRSELLIAVGIVATLFFSAGEPPGSEDASSQQS